MLSNLKYMLSNWIEWDKKVYFFSLSSPSSCPSADCNGIHTKGYDWLHWKGCYNRAVNSCCCTFKSTFNLYHMDGSIYEGAYQRRSKNCKNALCCYGIPQKSFNRLCKHRKPWGQRAAQKSRSLLQCKVFIGCRFHWRMQQFSCLYNRRYCIYHFDLQNQHFNDSAYSFNLVGEFIILKVLNKKQKITLDDSSKLSSKLDYFYKLSKSSNASKDIKLYGFQDYFIYTVAKITSNIEKIIAKYTNQSASVSGIRAVLNLIRQLISYVYLIYLVTIGCLTVSEFVFISELLQAFQTGLLTLFFLFKNWTQCERLCRFPQIYWKRKREQG